MVDTIAATDPHTVLIHLKFATSAFLPALADPYNWIYQKKILDQDPHWYEHNIMGSGRFAKGLVKIEPRCGRGRLFSSATRSKPVFPLAHSSAALLHSTSVAQSILPRDPVNGFGGFVAQV